MDAALTLISSANGQRDRTQEWLDGRPHSSLAFPETLNENSDEHQGLATRLYSLCLRLLLSLCQREQNISSKNHEVPRLKEELGKLYLWGEAFSGGKLDRALAYSDDVRGNVLDSLGGIGSIILRELWPSSLSQLPGDSLQKSVYELQLLVDQTKDITSTRDHVAAREDSDWADGSDTDKESSSDDDDTTNNVDELQLQTQWLTQLAPILEQNLVSAQNPRIQASLPVPVPFSVSGPAKVYVSLVREKYKLAQDKLVERLGEANWQRHVSVRKSIEASVNIAEEPTAPIENSAVALSIFKPYSTFHDSALGPSILTQTEYAPSHTSFQSSNTEGERESIRVPATPVEVADGKPFQCFLCKRVLSNIKNRVDWKVHVFADLKPYICTFADCEDELAQFYNRAAWASHEFSRHRITQSWKCPECPEAFSELLRWQSHIKERHCLFFSDQSLDIAKDIAFTTETTRIEDEECPLCRTVLGKPRRAFVKHVGRHMEEIALMALPRNVEEDSGEGSVSTDHNDLSFQKIRTNFQTNQLVEPERAVLEANTRSSGSPSPFACEHCDQTFSKGSELMIHLKVHTGSFRCVVPRCKFLGFEYQEGLLRHMREEHSTTVDDWEAKALENGYTEEDTPGHRRSTTTNTVGVTGQAENSSQRSISPPRLYEHTGRLTPLIDHGGVDALGPPGPDHLVPPTPPWLSQALVSYQQTYPDDRFKATARLTAVSTISGLEKQLVHNKPVPPETKFVYEPRVRCLDCPGKLYKTGPGDTLDNFKVHLHNRIHRERVDQRRTLLLPDVQESAPAPQRESPSKARQDALNEFFISGEGIHSEVLQRDICKYLGPEAYSRPLIYNRQRGYVVTAVRPFTSLMLDDLIEDSKLYTAANPDKRKLPSYWSVPEQCDFYNFVHHFGTNWQAIAANMKTKTAIMIKDFYNRKIQEGESGRQLKEDVERVNSMIENGEDMGPVPTPTPIGVRRRYGYQVGKVPEPFIAPVQGTNSLDRFDDSVNGPGRAQSARALSPDR